MFLNNFTIVYIFNLFQNQSKCTNQFNAYYYIGLLKVTKNISTAFKSMEMALYILFVL